MPTLMVSEFQMRPSRLRSINLNLLPILQSLLTTRSVTRTAEQLHMSQPGVSDALAKLRIHYKDDLLVRAGGEMQPTQLALALQEELNGSIEALERVIERETFDPGVLERRFVIATADVVVLALVNNLIEDLQKEAPGVMVQFEDLPSDYFDSVRTGSIDLLLGPQYVLETKGLVEMALYDETVVCIARKNHPRIKGRLSTEDYRDLAHASFRANQRTDKTFQTLHLGAAPNDIVRLPYYTLMPVIVEESDVVAMIPKRAAEYYAKRHNIQILNPPFKVPNVTIAAYWSRIHDRDPAHVWFREKVRSAVPLA